MSEHRKDDAATRQRRDELASRLARQTGQTFEAARERVTEAWRRGDAKRDNGNK